jgi:hypothetical protein
MLRSLRLRRDKLIARPRPTMVQPTNSSKRARPNSLRSQSPQSKKHKSSMISNQANKENESLTEVRVLREKVYGKGNHKLKEGDRENASESQNNANHPLGALNAMERGKDAASSGRYKAMETDFNIQKKINQDLEAEIEKLKKELTAKNEVSCRLPTTACIYPLKQSRMLGCPLILISFHLIDHRFPQFFLINFTFRFDMSNLFRNSPKPFRPQRVWSRLL